MEGVIPNLSENKPTIHYDLGLDYEFAFIACIYTQWENKGDVNMPSWKNTTEKDEVTCKRCLGMIKTDFRSLD